MSNEYPKVGELWVRKDEIPRSFFVREPWQAVLVLFVHEFGIADVYVINSGCATNSSIAWMQKWMTPIQCVESVDS